jgi:hypothetical protein
MDVTLGGEKHPLATGIRPLTWILAAVGVTSRDHRVGGPAEFLRIGLVAADEDDKRKRGAVLRVPVLMSAPAADHAVVTLELVDVLGRFEGAVELDEDVDHSDALTISQAQLDGGIRLDRGELLDRHPSAGAVGAQEAVRGASAWQPQLIWSNRTAVAVACPQRRAYVGVARPPYSAHRVAQATL